jgi:hypothetical protein
MNVNLKQASNGPITGLSLETFEGRPTMRSAGTTGDVDDITVCFWAVTTQTVFRTIKGFH